VIRNYLRPRVEPKWAESRETHIAVATAIFAIAGPDRSPDAIWGNPTEVEWNQVRMAVEQYIREGDFPPASDNRYSWKQEGIELPSDSEGIPLQVGDRVEGGQGEPGRIVEFLSPPKTCDLRVVWDSGVKTPAAARDLRRIPS
jgi:hypothetical protein